MSAGTALWRQTELETRERSSSERAQPFSGHALWYLLLYSIFILAGTAVIASRRHLWWDEIQTMLVATLPNMKAIWNALLSGADWQSPAVFLPLHWLSNVFGASPLVGRLVGIVPYWLATLVLYFTVARRTKPVYGFIAMLFPSLTGAFVYAFEMRPYAFVLLFTVCTFLSWQLTKEYRFRRFALPALTISLGALVCFHYNACLVALPLLVGEAAIAFRRRKVDYPVLLSIACAALALLPLVPDIRASRHFAATYHIAHNYATFLELYMGLFSRAIVLGFVLCAAFFVWRAFLKREVVDLDLDTRGLPYWEIAAAASFLPLPIVYFVLSMYTGALHYRHVLDTVIGASILLAYLCYAWRRPLARLPNILLFLLLCNLLVNVSGRLRSPDELGWGTYARYSDLFNGSVPVLQQSQEPIAMGDGAYLLAHEYGSPDLAQRSYYVMGNPQWRNAAPDAVFKRNFFHAFTAMLPPGRMHAPEYDAFVREHHHFLLYDPDPWLVKRLIADGQEVKARALLDVGPVYSVNIK
jgi:hypothetical protein